MKRLVLEIAEPDMLNILENSLIPSIQADEVKKVYHDSLINLGLTQAVHHLAQAILSAMVGDGGNKERHLDKALSQVISAPCRRDLMQVAALIKTLDLGFEIDGEKCGLVN